MRKNKTAEHMLAQKLREESAYYRMSTAKRAVLTLVVAVIVFVVMWLLAKELGV